MMMQSSDFVDAHDIEDAHSGGEILDLLEDRFRSLGATHFLVTGIPFPGRPLAPLVLRAKWGQYNEDATEALNIPHSDPVFQTALRGRRSFLWPAQADGSRQDSTLLSLTGAPREVDLVGVPVTAYAPYQACIIAAGKGISLEPVEMLGLDFVCAEAFGKLFALNYLRPDRPGELSARERRVVEMSALGKTARDIATQLKISQRTVHAHLQNASDKLRATNKTQTVVEAMVYGQINL